MRAEVKLCRTCSANGKKNTQCIWYFF